MANNDQAFGESYPITGSTLTRRVAAGLSTHIIVYVETPTGWDAVGAIQNLTATETCSLKRIGEVRTGRTIEIIPQGQDVVQLQVTRLVFDNLKLLHAIGAGFSHIRAQRIPFDIVIYDRTHDEAANSFRGPAAPKPHIMIYKNCWLGNLTTTYNANAYTIAESALIESEGVADEHPIIQALNERGLSPRYDQIESEYDIMKDNRGSLSITDHSVLTSRESGKPSPQEVDNTVAPLSPPPASLGPKPPTTLQFGEGDVFYA
jgi:hypothetical protein